MPYFDISWDSLIPSGNGNFQLFKAQFTGPGISESYPLLESDSINIDLTKQFYPFTDTFFIANLSWKGARYRDSFTVEFSKLTISHLNLTMAKNLSSSDILRVYLEGHDDNSHPNNFLYKAEVLNENKGLKFNGK